MLRRSVSVALCLVIGLAGAARAEQVAAGHSANLRALDRMSGELTDLNVAVGESVTLERLRISLVECRFPVDNPVGDAYAYVVIDDANSAKPLFQGWMVASSPALNPFDDMRYDVWVLRCNNS